MTPDHKKAITFAEEQLIKMDPLIGGLVSKQRPINHIPRTDYFYSLCRSIIGQQVSVASAKAIFGRLEVITSLDPVAVMGLSEDDIKTIGLSRSKAAYITDLARHFVDNPNVYNHLDKQTDEAVIAELTSIKGIGVWTAQMFLMFTLTRLDVFAPDDVGIQRGMKQLYNWTVIPPKHELETIAEQWRPYRTASCWHLWHSLQNTPTT